MLLKFYITVTNMANKFTNDGDDFVKFRFIDRYFAQFAI